MMKRCLSLLAAVVLVLLPLAVAGADGGSSSSTSSDGTGGGRVAWDPNAQAYMYTEPRYGICICSKMSVRDRASTGGKTLASLTNGQPVRILGVTQDGNWYLLDLESCKVNVNVQGAYGYGKSSLIKIDPEFIGVTSLVNLYATPWSTDLKNGEQTNRFFLIIDRYSDWYAVQARESNPGTAFIRGSEIGQYSSYSKLYVVTWDTKLLDDNHAEITTVKRFSVCSLITGQGDFAQVVFNAGTNNEYGGLIENLFLAPIVN